MATSAKKTARQPWEELDDDLEETAFRAPLEEAAAIDDALGLQMISIRLQKSLLTNLKAIAEHHGVGYQPLIRDLLNRFARSEMHNIFHAMLKEKQDKIDQLELEMESQAKMEPIDDFLARESERKRA